VASQITSPGSAPPLAPTNVVISSNAQNLNLWNHLLSTGAASAGVAGSWTVTIASGVIVGSASSTLPALDTGVFPAGSTLQLVNNGTIAGAGGKGGNGAVCLPSGSSPATPGLAGGTALRAQVALSVVNNGAVWGGGGGGGGGVGNFGQAGGGGGGAGMAVAAGGTPGGGAGTLSTGGAGYDSGFAIGGNGGDAGQPGSTGGISEFPCQTVGAGGAAGAATIGNSFITWTTAGDRRGPLN